MTGPEFASCRLKLQRADEHLSALKAELTAWNNREPYSVGRKYDHESGRHSLIVNIDGSAPFDRLSLIAGDCAHNLRCALDHFVYALAVRDTGLNPPPNPNLIQFPLVESSDAFQKQRYRIASLSKATQDFIESKQPYQRRHEQLPPILGVLNDFDNIDKHRLIHVVYSYNPKGKIVFVAPLPNLSPLGFQWVNEPLESGKEFLYFITSPPNPDVQYLFTAHFCIAVRHIPGPKGRVTSPLESVMVAMKDEVKRIVNELI